MWSGEAPEAAANHQAAISGCVLQTERRSCISACTVSEKPSDFGQAAQLDLDEWWRTRLPSLKFLAFRKSSFQSCSGISLVLICEAELESGSGGSSEAQRHEKYLLWKELAGASAFRAAACFVLLVFRKKGWCALRWLSVFSVSADEAMKVQKKNNLQLCLDSAHGGPADPLGDGSELTVKGHTASVPVRTDFCWGIRRKWRWDPEVSWGLRDPALQLHPRLQGKTKQGGLIVDANDLF